MPVKGFVLYLLFFSGALFSVSSLAVPRSSSLTSGSKEMISHWLQQSSKGSFQKIVQAGPEGYRTLVDLSFSSSTSASLRWQAFLTLVRIGGRKSLPEVEKALQSSDWFMRSAALVALQKVKFSRAVPEAKKVFVKDASLLVRAQALEVLTLSADPELFSVFWDQLWSQKNFYRGRGLWIREKIAAALGESAQTSDLKKISRLLSSSRPEDQSLKPHVISGLRRLLGSLDQELVSENERVAFWQSHLKAVTSQL